MRSFLFALSLMCGTTCANAQTGTSTSEAKPRYPYVYLETALSLGTHQSAYSDLNMIFHNNYILSLYYLNCGRNSPTVPKDYGSDLLGFKPLQIVSMSGLTFGKLFYSKSPLIRYVLKGGISLGTVSTPENFVKVYHTGGWFWSGPNYEFTNHKEFTPGILLNPEIEFTLGRYFGFTFGGFADLNPISTVAGFDLGLIFGKVRNHRTDYRQ